MSKIIILQPHIANQIAAGEVVERPCSVVKELIENALDANATHVSVEIKNGGIDYIRVSDNGIGIQNEDVLTAFMRHATSKIKTQEDLNCIETLGFRGEALSSIAAVAQVEFMTKSKTEPIGTYVRFEGGEMISCKEIAYATGSAMTVENIFYNVPARRKFLKSARTESAAIGEQMARFILSRPDVNFKYINNDKTIYTSIGDNNLKSAIFSVFGLETIKHLRSITFDDGYLQINGFIGLPEIARPNRKDQYFFINRRCVQSYMLSNALGKAYGDRLMGGRFPFAIISITINSGEIDINVHPSKLEVRFADENRIWAALNSACKTALGAYTLPEIKLNSNANTDVVQTPDNIYNSGNTDAGGYRPFVQDIPNMENNICSYLFDASDKNEALLMKESAVTDIPHYYINVDEAKLNSKTETTDDEQTQIHFEAEPFLVIGQAFNSYWFVQQKDKVFIIDQHAAHERRLYQKMIKAGTGNDSCPQPMLTPCLININQSEKAVYEDNERLLNNMGFAIEPFGENTLKVSEIPIELIDCNIEHILREAFNALKKHGNTSTMDLKKEAIIQSACKHAIKAGDNITKEEITELIKAINDEGMPLTCPHGRPVLIALKKSELEKMFKRIL